MRPAIVLTLSTLALALPAARPALAAEECILPPGLSAWPSPARLAGDRGALLAGGGALEVQLVPQAEVAILLEPRGEEPEGSTAATLPLRIEHGGTYRITLDQPAWIDVVGNGTALVSTGHGHAPDCSGIRKFVDFEIGPGDYEIQLSGASITSLLLMIVPIAPA